MGEAFAGRKVGKKAMLWGAMAQSIPDIDFLAAFWMDTTSNLLAHRGFTHSILFCVLITPVMAMLAERWHRPHNISLLRWLMFFFAVIFIHIFLDAMNNYGVGWYEPFSHRRISFNILYIADPLFSIWPGIATVILLLKKGKDRDRIKWWVLGLGLSAVYLCYAALNKMQVINDVNENIAAQEIEYTRCFIAPTVGQSWLWYVVVGNDKGYHIGYRSIFDKTEKIDFHYFPRNDELLDPKLDHEASHKLIRFSQEFYTIEQWDEGLVFNDLRFGQIMGWQDPLGKFVFYYYLKEPNENRLVVQRGRFSGWNRDAVHSLWTRIKGI